MPLSASVSINKSSYAVGSNPPPQVLLTVFNPTANAVAVMGVQFFFKRLDGVHPTPSAAQMVAPTGLGATVSVPSLQAITIGPTSLAAGSAASYTNRLQSVPPVTGQADNPQPTQVLAYTLIIGAYVMASDGTINTAAPAGILVCPWQPPTVALQAGDLNWSIGRNFLNGLLLGVL